MDTAEAASAGGIFQVIGDVVARWPLLVIGFWIVLAAGLTLIFPPLPVVAAKSPPPGLPDDAPMMITAREMADAFGGTGSASILMVVLTNENGLTSADEQTYRKLVATLQEDKKDILAMQEFATTPPLRQVLASKDNKAWNLPITLDGKIGSPQVRAEYNRVARIVKDTVAGTTLTADLSGPVGTIVDVTELGEQDMHFIEIGTGMLVLAILIVVYRNVITMLVPLATIGVSLVTAQGTLAGFSQLGLGINTQTIVLLTGVMMGAGTDYAVFLLSRYHDYVRLGEDSDQAVKKALNSIGKVIAASAATVSVTFLAMVFSKLDVFATVGPAIAIAVVVALLAALTLLPAILILTGRRGWIKPKHDLTQRFWRRTAIRTVRRPRIHLVGSLIVLIALASCVAMVRFNYDDRKSLPDSVESARGFAAVDRHFPINSMNPQLLFIQSPRDLRSPRALADLEQMAQRVSQLPNIIMVRGLTRPTGEPLEQTKLSFQAGEVGGKLDDASNQISARGSDLDRLAGGANQLADALADVRNQVTSAVAGVSTLVNALSYMEGVFGGDRTLNDLDQTANLAGNMRSLGDALSANIAGVNDTVGWAAPMLAALNASPVCDADPACDSSRAELQQLVTARDSGTLDSVADLAHNLQSTQGLQPLGSTVSSLKGSLNTAVSALQSVGGIKSRIAQVQQGADQLADGSRQLADGVQELVSQTKRIGSGLNEASDFLLSMKRDAGSPSMAGFNVPPQAMNADEFKKAAQIFISGDGHAARYFVQSALDPFTPAAMDQVNTILKAAKSARPNTELSDAKISLGGVPTGLRDTRDYYNYDVKFIVITTIAIVFLILVGLLRALVAPLYLIGSVLISYLSALGLGVILFQFILDKPLHWSLPGLTFILLVAVGADYNMLLISRIRDESPHGVRFGVIRTVSATGSVITSAGLIFAASMFGLLFASIITMVQAGFIIGIGIVLDTFLVRTITVPAMAALVGQANWWPSRLGKGKRQLARSRQRGPVLNLAGLSRIGTRISGNRPALVAAANRRPARPQQSAVRRPARSQQPANRRPTSPQRPTVRRPTSPQRPTVRRPARPQPPAVRRVNGQQDRARLPNQAGPHGIWMRMLSRPETYISVPPLPPISVYRYPLDALDPLDQEVIEPDGNQPAGGHLVPGHALPLFGADDLREADSVPVTADGNGKHPVDDLCRHALPVFGAHNLPAALSDSAAATGSGEAPIEDAVGHALPVFGLQGLREAKSDTVVTADTASGKRLIEDLLGHALPLFGVQPGEAG